MAKSSLNAIFHSYLKNNRKVLSYAEHAKHCLTLKSRIVVDMIKIIHSYFSQLSLS